MNVNEVKILTLALYLCLLYSFDLKYFPHNLQVHKTWIERYPRQRQYSSTNTTNFLKIALLI